MKLYHVSKFTRRELEEFLSINHLAGIYKLDCMPRALRNRHYDAKQFNMDNVFLERCKSFKMPFANKIVIGMYYPIKYKVFGKMPIEVGYVIAYKFNNSNNVYVSGIEIKRLFRNHGIGSYILKKHFPGAFIIAGNERVKNLYERMAEKPYEKFSKKEKEEFNDLTAATGYGTYKLR